MKTRFPIALPLIFSLLCSVAAAQQIPPENKKLADNAALVYWQAFSLMPDLDDSEEESLDNLLEGKKADQQVSKKLRQANESLRLLRRAMKFSQCEWGLEYERGIEMTLPHLSQARKLSKLACARARVRFAEGQNQAAIDDTLAALSLARRIGENAAVISLLVDYAIENQVAGALRTNLPEMEKSDLDRLAEGIDDLPDGKTMADGWRMEKELLLGWFIRELRKPGSKERVLKMFPNQDDPSVVALAEMSQKEALESALSLREVYDKIIVAIAMPPHEVDAFVAELTANLDSMGTAKHFGALIIPSVQNLRRAEAVHETESTMLVAAIAVAKDGQDALQRDEFKDPYGKGPFQYKAVGSGFRLTSKLIGRDGKPVTLTVGE